MLKREFFRFLLVGTLNTVFSYALYLFLNRWLRYELAFGVAYVAGILFSYWLNAQWVFQVKATWRSFLSYPSVYVVQFAINLLGLHVLVERLSLPEQLAPLIVIICSIPITFLMSRYIVKPSKQ